MKSTLENFLFLKQGKTKYGPAPHKPVLLLAVIELFEEGIIIGNWIEPSAELVSRFQDIWSTLVSTNHIPTFALPFFHLKNEKGGWWNLVVFPGKTIPTTKSKSIKSYRALIDSVAAAILSIEFYSIISNQLSRLDLKRQVLKHYFGVDILETFEKPNTYSNKVKEEIVYDPSENYVRKVKRKLIELPKELYEQEIAIRSHIFRKAILDIYDSQCAITGLQVKYQDKPTLIDACHISPFAESYDDTIRNGIALSPNIHRAFDRGLIAISDEYTVMIHKQVKDHSRGNGIIQFAGKGINLPHNEDYHPDLNRLGEHRVRFGF